MAGDLLLGAIADDYTGATDLAGMLSAEGVRTVQVLGLQPRAQLEELRGRYQAVVIALKSRAEPVAQARAASLEALGRLRDLGARQIYFKYCSTFDSTTEGNIGPVTEALMSEMGVRFTIAVPALPVNGRTQYLGHLFVDGVLLSESPLRHHPLTPMTEPNLVRHLQAQTRQRVGLLAAPVVRRGPAALIGEMARLEDMGVGIALVDVLGEEDLATIAAAAAERPLVTGSSGLAMKLPGEWRRRGWLDTSDRRAPRPRSGGGVLVLSGSCSARTLEQIGAFEAAGGPVFRLDLRRLLFGDGAAESERVASELMRAIAGAPAALVCSSMPAPEREALLLEARGSGVSAEGVRRGIEQTMASIASRAVEGGVRQIVVAGGETSGAVVEALRVTVLEIGAVIEPGVPHCMTVPAPDGSLPSLDLVLKSGNFGGPDFFLKAVRYLREGAS